MIYFKKLNLLAIALLWYAAAGAQGLTWFTGTWQGTETSPGSSKKLHSSRFIIIDSINGTHFTGTKTKQLDGKGGARIVTAISGSLNQTSLIIQNGEILFKKDPPAGEWWDCSACSAQNKIFIRGTRIIISSRIAGCQRDCDGIAEYYKNLCDFDSSLQTYLVNLFADPADAGKFKPCRNPPPVDSAELKRIEDSLKNAALIAKQRQQEIADSLKNAALLAKQRQQEVDDSTKAAARLRQQQIADSLKNVAALAQKRQQEIADSLKTAKGLEKIRQQQIADSLRIVADAARKRQQFIEDSLRTAAQLGKKRQQQVDDSLRNAQLLAKKRQQEIDDSLQIVAANAKRLADQQKQDSLRKAAELAKQIAAAKTATPPADTAKASTTKAFETRDNVLVESYHITSPDILIQLFDNAQIDGDRVSVFHNNQLVVNNKTLAKQPITFTIHADAENRTHEFVLIAENLGSIPPNTALMRITSGKQEYELTVRTDLTKNAKIVLYYDGN